MNRIAIIDKEKCKPKKCKHECKRICPVNQSNKVCIDIEETAIISEDMCIGCGLCVQKCPFDAIKIVNIPSEVKNSLYFSYGENAFKLYKFLIPKQNEIVGLLGQNGTGKTTILNILCKKLLLNFGNKFDEKDVINKLKGTELQKYMHRLFANELTIAHKQQDIEFFLKRTKKSKDTIKDIVSIYNEHKNYNIVMKELELDKIINTNVNNLSGGEMQKLLCAVNLLKHAQVYIFDEPTNYLDIEFRFKVAELIKNLKSDDNYIFVVEHDLSALDYIADFVHILFGIPNAYGVVATQYTTQNAINIFFDGFIPADNMRFRDIPYILNDKIDIDKTQKSNYNKQILKFDDVTINYDNYCLKINGDTINENDNIIMLLGKNGTGKTTFLNHIKNSNVRFSHKPQFINSFLQNNAESLDCDVKSYLYNNVDTMSTQFISDVIKPLEIDNLYGNKLSELSGGQLHKIIIACCLGVNADIYLIDEPSFSLDIEQRINIVKILKRFFIHNKKIGIIVEHDIMMSISLSTQIKCQIILFEESQISSGKRNCVSSKLLDFKEGMNKFLKQMNITFQTDKINHRPKINKKDSQKDNEQKKNNCYYKW